MNHTSKNQVCKFHRGDVIQGKWHHHKYEVIKKLGYGATGHVYLVKGKDGLAALKISNDSMAITSEVNVLRHFSKVQGTSLGPSLLDVDDFVHRITRKSISFYVMEYLKGEDLFTFLQKKGGEWLQVIILQLLADLDHLHKEGWVFGDLKPENLLIVGPPPKIRWLDVGGTTIIGRSVKEYTEFYDRGYWGLGSRRAEPSYDLFSVAMMMIQTQYTKRFSKSEGNTMEQLTKRIAEKQKLIPYKQVIINALEGKYATAMQMRNDILHHTQIKKKDSFPKSRKTYRTSVKYKKRNKKQGLLETALIASILLLGYVLYIFGQFI